jgi:hypothetical protein
MKKEFKIFPTVSEEERREKIRLLRGKYRNQLSDSREFAKNKEVWGSSEGMGRVR